MSDVTALMDRVQAAGGELIPLSYDQIKMRAPRPFPPDLVAELRRHKAELLEALMSAKMHTRIAAARDWRALEEVLNDAQMAFVAATLAGPQVEALAKACCMRAREIPEHAGD